MNTCISRDKTNVWSSTYTQFVSLFLGQARYTKEQKASNHINVLGKAWTLFSYYPEYMPLAFESSVHISFGHFSRSIKHWQ